ncbi:selenocysteine-specific translation elongation factor [Paenalkalicoccus suaedae]|uniref:Selenocysteine-specific elongation factor n=1 Tax=Paenalkalicoccus suaedae TaxID=2592382 RepID=A0A859FE17_9BACI|nr:selenocysteine-specific translation elongation factor [Paenalkalicoccus suaedae]QKS71337.1 selenocysteine-specific translation elongation factor [Paenalkalicoccus suaedae]
MEPSFYTVGMAGHIDHGKTTLTKALTNIDTDRLKEEKERAISIEPGYAPLDLGEDMAVSIVDVPGHEKFIRQMIAGVAGIDLVMLVIAADEGIMPQTREHVEIINSLGIEHGLIVVTKADSLDDEMEELIKEDIQDYVKDTFLRDCEFHFVDSISGKGITELKDRIATKLKEVPTKKVGTTFRLPIDQVFTVKGQGTVVRGTIYEGKVNEGDVLRLLPSDKEVRVRQIQVHHKSYSTSQAGQRTAINVGGVSHEEISRGDVLVSSGDYVMTQVVDLALTPVTLFEHALKQRTAIKLHIGTAEVFGKVVFFDRNELEPGDTNEVLCQVRLDEPVVTKRGDRFILRRPSPVETIGGGIVIQTNGGKYRFGQATVDQLSKIKEGTPKERVLDVLEAKEVAPISALHQAVGLSVEELQMVQDELVASRDIVFIHQHVMSMSMFLRYQAELLQELQAFHEQHPMRPGKDLASVWPNNQAFDPIRAAFMDQLVEQEKIRRNGNFVYLPEFSSSFPKQWAKRMEQVTEAIKVSGIEVADFEELTAKAGLPEEQQVDLAHYLIREKIAVRLDDKRLVSNHALDEAKRKLQSSFKESFTLQDAKSVLGLSRKYLVPLLELFDELGWTKRQDQIREWK